MSITLSFHPAMHRKQTFQQTNLFSHSPFCSAEHNLPDSPFASPTKSKAFAHDPFKPTELEIAAASTGCNASYVGINNNGGSLANHLRPSALDIPSPKNYFFPMSRYAPDSCLLYYLGTMIRGDIMCHTI